MRNMSRIRSKQEARRRGGEGNKALHQMSGRAAWLPFLAIKKCSKFNLKFFPLQLSVSFLFGVHMRSSRPSLPEKVRKFFAPCRFCTPSVHMPRRHAPKAIKDERPERIQQTLGLFNRSDETFCVCLRGKWRKNCEAGRKSETA